MPDATVAGAMSEPQFASLVDAIASDPDRRGQLTGLLRENHTIYADRGTAAIARMRGWILLAMAQTGVSDAALVFVLEELDSGTDPYLVAAAARALRSSRRPHASFAPFVMGALANIRYLGERYQPRPRAAGDAGVARSAGARRSPGGRGSARAGRRASAQVRA
jgi:hypothetical protein